MSNFKTIQIVEIGTIQIAIFDNNWSARFPHVFVITYTAPSRMATGVICAGNSQSISYLYPQIDYKRHEKFICRPLKLFQYSENGAGCLNFNKPEMLSRAPRNGGKVGPICALKQVAISLPNIGSGMSVLQSSLKTSVNLIAICSFVAWLQKSGQLPAETSTVLSQIAFRLTIPCFLMSTVSKAIAFQPQGKLLSIPFISILQILVGAMLGKAAIMLMRKDSYMIRVNASDGSSCRGEPMERDEILAKNDALVIAACAFGNTVTLPLVILSGMLSSNDATTAAGFVALFMVGWSPFLWSYGYQMFGNTYGKSSHLNGVKSRSFLQMCTTWFQRIMNPPLYGILVGILIGGTPLVHIFFPVKETVPSVLRKTNGTLAMIYLGSAGFLQSVWEAASLLGSASVAVQVILLALSLAPSIPVFNKMKSNSDAGQLDEYKSSTESGTPSQFVLDSQVFWVITCVRLIAMPVAGLLLVKILHGADILPSNPVCILTILILSAMPSAQNLIVLLQLRSSTRCLVGVVADLLVRQYALSLVSLPLWVTAYAAVIPRM